MIYSSETAYSAAVPTAGFILELAADSTCQVRVRLLDLLSKIARGPAPELGADDAHPPGAERWARAARDAVEAGMPTLLALLDDADPAVRAAAAFVLADFPEHERSLIPVLRAKVHAETAPGAAASMVLAVGELTGEGDDPPDDPPVEWLTGLLAAGESREVRAAAAIALLWCGIEEPPQVGTAIADEVAAAESGLDGQLWVSPGDRVGFLTSVLDAHPYA
ncbi:MAG TPA: HEAT repeat domain-containing protein [Actinoplanes sp.]|jgi:hypothetical protein|nr:HEAT repeat domain-containing protein [Actinoplanes sp.]